MLFRSVAFVPDAAATAKDRLHEIYYAQRAYRENNGHWARSLEELALRANAQAQRPAALELTPTGFEATVELPLSRKKAQHWHIRQDARVWCD